MDKKRPRDGQMTTATAYVDRAEDWARLLEERQAHRAHTRIAEAIGAVARHTAVPHGTLVSLRKHRLKSIPAHLYARLRAGVISELEAELARLEHELAFLRTPGVNPSPDETAAVVEDISAVRKALGLGPDPSKGGT